MLVKAITVRVDDDVKAQAEVMLEDIGINMTTYIVSSLKALVREKRIPFEMVTTQYLEEQMVFDKLTENEKEADASNMKGQYQNSVFGKTRARDVPEFLD